ncbi:hypothetical protein J7373_10985 [Xanthomonas sp. A2111]|uniref:Uncharacterized protein n=1 Tax=Xanthomonas hawaiiensis TaxID=3003247 RepID=A0ABU2I1L2_9XANT|nr:hypothetical protein [Xanthomonas sp. A2111]MBO9828773.1 hypothetical protein [Xanthomonas sp. A2111]MDS9992035.1 hypothetical protein [Xanthomonas sp. A2111]
MDASINPAILKMIETMCQDAKDELEIMADYAKAEISGNPNQKDLINDSLEEIIKAKDTASQSSRRPSGGVI